MPSLLLSDLVKHGLELCVGPFGELLMASDVGLIAGVVLLDEGINFGKFIQAHVELIDGLCGPCQILPRDSDSRTRPS